MPDVLYCNGIISLTFKSKYTSKNAFVLTFEKKLVFAWLFGAIKALLISALVCFL